MGEGDTLCSRLMRLYGGMPYHKGKWRIVELALKCLPCESADWRSSDSCQAGGGA